MNDNRCAVCLGSQFRISERTVLAGPWISATCQRCGTFQFHEDCWGLLDDEGFSSLFGGSTSRQRANASGYVRENQGLRIAVPDLDWLAGLKTPTIHDRADKLLLALERETKEAGQPVDLELEGSKWIALAWCLSARELTFLLKYLRSVNFVEHTPDQSSMKETIQPDGFAHLETLRERGAATSQGFIAMNMIESLDPLWHRGLEAGIEAAGYKPLRIDRKLDTDKLDDEILAEIRRSKFLVADLTNQRPSVYLEVGYAMGLGMRVFRTCRKDEIDAKKLAFDLATYHCIAWEVGKERELVKPLKSRIVARLGEGPLKRPEMLAFFYRNPEERSEQYEVRYSEAGRPAQQASIESDDALRAFLRSARPQEILRTGLPDSSGNSVLIHQTTSFEAAFREISALRENDDPVRLMFFESDFQQALLAATATRA